MRQFINGKIISTRRAFDEAGLDISHYLVTALNDETIVEASPIEDENGVVEQTDELNVTLEQIQLRIGI